MIDPTDHYEPSKLSAGEYLCKCDLITCHDSRRTSCDAVATVILAHESIKHTAALCEHCALKWRIDDHGYQVVSTDRVPPTSYYASKQHSPRGLDIQVDLGHPGIGSNDVPSVIGHSPFQSVQRAYLAPIEVLVDCPNCREVKCCYESQDTGLFLCTDCHKTVTVLKFDKDCNPIEDDDEECEHCKCCYRACCWCGEEKDLEPCGPYDTLEERELDR